MPPRGTRRMRGRLAPIRATRPAVWIHRLPTWPRRPVVVGCDRVSATRARRGRGGDRGETGAVLGEIYPGGPVPGRRPAPIATRTSSGTKTGRTPRVTLEPAMVSAPVGTQGKTVRPWMTPVGGAPPIHGCKRSRRCRRPGSVRRPRLASSIGRHVRGHDRLLRPSVTNYSDPGTDVASCSKPLHVGIDARCGTMADTGVTSFRSTSPNCLNCLGCKASG